MKHYFLSIRLQHTWMVFFACGKEKKYPRIETTSFGNFLGPLLPFDFMTVFRLGILFFLLVLFLKPFYGVYFNDEQVQMSLILCRWMLRHYSFIFGVFRQQFSVAYEWSEKNRCLLARTFLSIEESAISNVSSCFHLSFIAVFIVMQAKTLIFFIIQLASSFLDADEESKNSYRKHRNVT